MSDEYHGDPPYVGLELSDEERWLNKEYRWLQERNNLHATIAAQAARIEALEGALREGLRLALTSSLHNMIDWEGWVDDYVYPALRATIAAPADHVGGLMSIPAYQRDAAPAGCTCDVPPALASRLLGPNHEATCPMYRAAPAEGETK